MKSNDFGYFMGFKNCGCFVSITVIDSNHIPDLNKTLLEWEKNGLTIKYSPKKPSLDDFGCKHK